MDTRKTVRVEDARASWPSSTPEADRRDPAAVALGERIRIARDAEGLTQAELARRIGGHVNTISKWERGLSVPSALELARIAHEVKRPVEALLDEPRDRSKDTFHHPPQAEVGTSLDVSLLAETLAAVADGLQRRQLTLPPAAFAELVSVIYEQEAVQRAMAPGSTGDVAGTTTRVLRLFKAA